MYYSTTHLAHGIDITDIEAQYDENAKALMADKQVLARIPNTEPMNLKIMTFQQS